MSIFVKLNIKLRYHILDSFWETISSTDFLPISTSTLTKQIFLFYFQSPNPELKFGFLLGYHRTYIRVKSFLKHLFYLFTISTKPSVPMLLNCINSSSNSIFFCASRTSTFVIIRTYCGGTLPSIECHEPLHEILI